MVEPKKESKGGLLDLFMGLFSKLTPIITGITSALAGVGAALGGGVLTGAIGLAGAAGALGASIWTLKESYDTTVQLNKQDHDAVKEKMRSAQVYAKSMEDIADKNQRDLFSIEREKSRLETEITQINLRKRASERGGASRYLGESLGLVKGFDKEDEQKLKTLQQQLKEQTNKEQEVKVLIENAKPDNREKETIIERIEKDNKPTDGAKETIIERIEKVSEKPIIVAQDNPLLVELRDLKKTLISLSTGQFKEINKMQDVQQSVRLSRLAASGPMNVPDSTMSRAPQASAQTETIRS